MDDWDDDAYAAIYDEQDRERTASSDNTKNTNCCAIPLVFTLIAMVLVILI